MLHSVSSECGLLCVPWLKPASGSSTKFFEDPKFFIRARQSMAPRVRRLHDMRPTSGGGAAQPVARDPRRFSCQKNWGISTGFMKLNQVTPRPHTAVRKESRSRRSGLERRSSDISSRAALRTKRSISRLSGPPLRGLDETA